MCWRNDAGFAPNRASSHPPCSLPTYSGGWGSELGGCELGWERKLLLPVVRSADDDFYILLQIQQWPQQHCSAKGMFTDLCIKLTSAFGVLDINYMRFLNISAKFISLHTVAESFTFLLGTSRRSVNDIFSRLVRRSNQARISDCDNKNVSLCTKKHCDTVQINAACEQVL